MSGPTGMGEEEWKGVGRVHEGGAGKESGDKVAVGKGTRRGLGVRVVAEVWGQENRNCGVGVGGLDALGLGVGGGSLVGWGALGVCVRELLLLVGQGRDSVDRGGGQGGEDWLWPWESGAWRS